jgi:stearoyl-CoA desaturase (Delta-9 desaturase)
MNAPLSVTASEVRDPLERIEPVRQIPFIVMHLMPFAAIYTGTRWQDWAVCIALYYVRMVFVTLGYHRYFSHKTFKMGRVMQFLVAFGAESSSQKGALWWAANHRHHHRYSDQPEDVHSPKQSGFFWSHVGWMMSRKHDETQWNRIKDFSKFPELVFINKHWWLPPTILGVVVFLVGGPSMLFIGFFLSTVLLWHGTFTINSLSHVFGKRRYATTDTSRNNWLLALITCGEGWHNNHHHFCASANQGFYWWEVDVSYYCIKALELLGLAWDVRKPSAAALERNRLDRDDGRVDTGLLPALTDAAE